MGDKGFPFGKNYQFPLRSFIFISIYTYLIWQSNLFVYKWLDRRVNFHEMPQSRFIKQIFFCLIAAFITFSAVYLITLSIYSGKFNINIYLYGLLIAFGISIGINTLYVFKYMQMALFDNEQIKTQQLNEALQKLRQNDKIKAATALSKTPELILIEAGNKILNMQLSDIAYFFSSQGMVVLMKKDGQKLITNYNSFKSILDRLPADIFFQLNRQFVVHINSIKSVAHDTNKKLIVEILGNASEKVTISRYRSAEFKIWFTKHQSLTNN